MKQPIPTAVLGATGAVGQRFLALLAHHPWFRIVSLHASRRRSGQAYRNEVRWLLPEGLPDRVARLPLRPIDEIPDQARLAFSALPAEVAGPVETAWAAAGRPVVSNAAAHRLDDDVPLIVPEINAEQLAWLDRPRAGPGFIVTNPNCSTAILCLALAPLDRRFGLRQVIVSTYQAASGAGYPGHPAVDLLGNVVPYIQREEDKLAHEPIKILGGRPTISPHCVRVPVQDGHLMTVSCRLERPPDDLDQVADAFTAFAPPDEVAVLPSAPQPTLCYRSEPDRPQPRLDRDRGGGMAITIGRLRRCSVLDVAFVALGHNTLRGGAGGAVLLGELLASQGRIPTD